jgi:hypothetical protein
MRVMSKWLENNEKMKTFRGVAMVYYNTPATASYVTLRLSISLLQLALPWTMLVV